MKPAHPPVGDQKAAQRVIFSEAETFFRQKAFGKALTAYNQYLAEFPQGSFAAASMMKIAAIYNLQHRVSEARDLYQKIISRYPLSVWAPEARIKILESYFKEKDYLQVIQQGPVFLKGLQTSKQQVQVYQMLGDSYMATGSAEQAIPAYISAYEKVQGDPKRALLVKIRSAIEKLTTEQVIMLLNRMQDKLLAGDLMYQMGLNYLAEKKYTDAFIALSDFVDMFKEHDKTTAAQKLIEKLKTEYIYERKKIGCLLPLSGPYEAIGNRALKGLELALNEITSLESQSGIQMVVKDTGADPDQAVQALNELYREKVAAIVGPIIAVEPAAQQAQKLKIPIITMTQKDHIADLGDYVFRNFITPRMQVETMVGYAVEKLGLKRFAVLYPDEKYGATFMNLFWDEIMVRQATVVGVEAYDPRLTDFADPIKKLVGLFYEVPEDIKEQQQARISMLNYLEPDRKPTAAPEPRKDEADEPKPIVDFDAVFIPDAVRKVGLIIPQLAFYDVENVYLLGTNLWHSEQLVQMAQQFVQGAIFTDGFFAQSTNVQVQEFSKRFQNIFGQKPEFIEAIAYDTARMLMQTVLAPEVQLREQIRDRLQTLKDFEGVTGPTTFTPNGDVRKKLYLLRVRKDEFVELKTQ